MRLSGVQPLLARVHQAPVTQSEILGLRLLTVHNVAFLLDLCRQARQAIVEDRFASFQADALARLRRRLGGRGMNWVTPVWIAVVIVGGYFLLFLPRRRMRQDQVRMREDLGPGDEIITVAGIIGTIRHVDDDEVQLEIAPDVVVRLVRRGIAGRLAQPEPDEPEEPDDDPD